MRDATYYKFFFIAILILDLTGSAQSKRPITVQDCVTARYLNDDGILPPIQINHQSTRLAYVIKNPNLDANRNDIQLFVKTLSTDSGGEGKLVLVADTISQIHWGGDGEHIFALSTIDSRVVVSNINVVTGKREVVASGESDIKEYTVDAAGNTIVFATDERQEEQIEKPIAMQVAQGYRISFQSEERSHQGWTGRRLFITRRSLSGIWSKPVSITVRSPFTGKWLTSFAFTPNLRLSIAPDGEKLVFTYLVNEELPDNWSNSLIGSLALNNGVPVMTVLLIDLDTMQAKLPFKTAWAFSVPTWSADSSSFAIVSTPPVGSSWEQTDAHDRQDAAGAAHLFWVKPDSGTVEEVASHVDNILQGPLWWGTGGEMLVQVGENTIARFSHNGGVWHESVRFKISLGSGSHTGYLVSDGLNFIAERDGPLMPPELVWYSSDLQRSISFAKLDTQFDMLTLAPAKPVEWETSSGYEIRGLLLVPPDYSEKIRYPLVIQAYHEPEKFFCDYGEGHWPSLVPQPLANAGIMYLIRTGGDEFKKEDRDHRPTGYPGGVGEAALQMEIWDGAVKAFAKRGWIDPNRVGIIGFSRTGWYTEFTLSHSKVPYAAATDTDNITYSLGEYWLRHSKGIIQGFDEMYGGHPYGEGLKNWESYSAAFNIDKIHTPLLMEEMGYGVLYNNQEAPPLTLVTHFDLFTGLNRLNKPVELYYYPLEDHTPDHPQARLASLQRNVDWYRFWLQGYERPNPKDPDQYKRWEHLRELQDAEGKAVKPTTADVPKPN